MAIEVTSRQVVDGCAVSPLAKEAVGRFHWYYFRLIISLAAYQPVNIAIGTPEGAYAH